MNTKNKGNLAISATIHELFQQGYNVFSELGDNSKIDLVAEKAGKILRIQVKFSSEKNGCICLRVKKTGQYGEYLYDKKDIDIFALYSPSLEKVIWIPIESLFLYKDAMFIRIKPTKNKQNNIKINYYNDFLTLGQLNGKAES